MKTTLHIDTSAVDTAKVVLETNGTKYEKTRQSRVMKSQTTLSLIEELLSEHAVKFSDISSITISVGPGSFTGLRVGCTIANALGMLLNIPVNGKRDLVIPVYS